MGHRVALHDHVGAATRGMIPQFGMHAVWIGPVIDVAGVGRDAIIAERREGAVAAAAAELNRARAAFHDQEEQLRAVREQRIAEQRYRLGSNN